ncbi:hypothetical protein V1478_012096, partial [Vespula squamosa]
MSCNVDPSLEFLLCYFSPGSFALRKTVLKEMEGRRMGGSGMGKVLLATLDVLLARVLVARDSSHRGEILVSERLANVSRGNGKLRSRGRAVENMPGFRPENQLRIIHQTNARPWKLKFALSLEPSLCSLEYARFLL